MLRGTVSTLALAATLFFASVSTVSCSSEPLGVAPAVDLSRFQGKWYEIAKLPRATQADCNGTTAFYTRNSDGTISIVNQCNVGKKDGPLKTVTMTATVPDPSSAAKLALQVGGYSGDYWIVDVGPSYEYAVIGHPSRQYLWILSRTPTIEAATVKSIIARAESQHFDTSKLEFTPQPPPNDRAEMPTPEGPVPAAVSPSCGLANVPSAGAPGGVAAVAVFAAFFVARRRRPPLSAR